MREELYCKKKSYDIKMRKKWNVFRNSHKVPQYDHTCGAHTVKVFLPSNIYLSKPHFQVKPKIPFFKTIHKTFQPQQTFQNKKNVLF